MAKTASELNTERLYNLLMPSAEAPEAVPYDVLAEEQSAVTVQNE